MTALQFRIERLESVDSTNTYALIQAKAGVAEGLVIVADFQTGGRGKPGNHWFSPRGENLLFSVLLRPPIQVNKAPILTQIACRSVAKALTGYGIESTFKRPNDIMVGGKKICGVLTESASTSQGTLECVVIGIGLNVNCSSADLLETATSMKASLNRNTPREALLEKILSHLKEDTYELYAHAG